MGKRRDRRHSAALGGGGRRMKLDLWNDDDAEKSSTKGKVPSITATVEEGDEKSGVGSDEGHSPHSLPGPVQVNPLSLLGQYSDEDEEEEKQSPLANGSSKGGPANVVTGQVDEQVASFLADLETSGLLKDDVPVHENEPETTGSKRAGSPSTAEVAGITRTSSSNGDVHEGAMFHGHGSLSSATQKDVDSTKKDMVCDWEAVLYQESGEYYYWNKVTSETTWEKPTALSEYEEWKEERDLQDRPKLDRKLSAEDHNLETKAHIEPLAQEAVSTAERVSDQELKVDSSVEQPCAVDLMEDTQFETIKTETANSQHPHPKDARGDIVDDTDIFPEVREKAEMIDSFPGATEINQSEIQDKEDTDIRPVVREKSGEELSQAEDFAILNIHEGEGGVLSDDSPAPGVTSSAITELPASTADQTEATALDRPGSRNIAEHARRKDHSRLVERGETLAQRFKILAGEALHSLSLRLRLVVEAEVRLSDCKALAMHNTGDEQYWEHMDSQITRLETLLSLEEASASVEEGQQKSTIIGDWLQGEPTKSLRKRAPAFRALRPPQQPHHSGANSDGEEGEKSQTEIEVDAEGVSSVRAQPEASPTPEVSSLKPEPLSSEVVERVGVEASESVPQNGITTEDEDMDVDMEVDMEMEDGNELGVPVVSISVDIQPRTVVMPSPYDYPVPQPVTYIPPEPLPQAVSYVPPDSLPQAVSYIPPATSLPAVIDASLFPSVAPLFPSVSPVFPALLPALPSFPADSWVPPPPPDDEWAPPPPPDFEAPPPLPDDEPPPLPLSSNAHPLESVSLPPHPSSPPPLYPLEHSITSTSYYPLTGNQATGEGDQPPGTGTGSGNYYTDSAKLVVGDVDAVSGYVNGTVPSTAGANTTVAESTSKKTGKVVRSKKRSHSMTVAASLRSNKKVSSMVNKWLAAKEELHSSEEEEEDKALFDIEALEKKRQKEIEEWRHQTLASGGALENANFQPLGTLDWRERVKRAKVVTKKEAAKQEEEAKKEEREAADATEESNAEVAGVAASASVTPPKRPDLKELAKDLPSGWQAFWDAESGEVYYGNLTTSETSWERPTG